MSWYLELEKRNPGADRDPNRISFSGSCDPKSFRAEIELPDDSEYGRTAGIVYDSHDGRGRGDATALEGSKAVPVSEMRVMSAALP